MSHLGPSRPDQSLQDLIRSTAHPAKPWPKPRPSPPPRRPGGAQSRPTPCSSVLGLSGRERPGERPRAGGRGHPGAVNALLQAVAADPTDAYAQHQLGFSLNAAGRPEEALAHFKRALELVPDIAWAQSNLLVTLVDLERCDENIPGLQPAVAASCNNHLGVLRENARRYRDAREHFERAVQAAPDSAPFHANLAGTLVKLGDRGDATLHARQARTLGLSDHWVFGALGE